MAIDLGNDPGGTPPTAGEKLQIRSAIGVGQTDAPTFLAQTLTGQSLTGTQETSLLNMAATWNTTGNPSLIYGRVTNTNSGTTANLIDLGTFAGGSLFKVDKTGILTAVGLSAGLNGVSTGTVSVGPNIVLSGSGSTIRAANGFAVNLGSADSSSADNFANLFLRSSAVISFGGDAKLYSDAPGILAQRNGLNAQALRVANSVGASPLVDYDRGTFGFPAGTNTLRIGTENGGTYTTARPIDFVVGGVARWQITAAGHFVAATHNTYDIGAIGGLSPRSIFAATNITAAATVEGTQVIKTSATGYIAIAGRIGMTSPSDGVLNLGDNAGTSFGRLQLGGTTDAFPAIARDGAGIKITGAATGSTSWIKVPAVAVSALPSAATAGVGARSFVNDALAPTFGSAVTGGGAVTVPVYSTGSAWNVG